MIRTLILYESKHGFTEEIARNLSLVLGPALLCKPPHFKGNWEEYEYIVICTPIASDPVDSDLIQYVSANSHIIRKKKVILLCTCLYEKRVDQYLESLRNQLGDSIIFSSVFGSDLITDSLGSSDFNKKFIELALQIKKIKDRSKKIAPGDRALENSIDDFINSHNTCALATGYDGSIRATPIEYTYINGFFYILSEGGEKFANIMMNPNVSLCIYNEFKGMNELGGIQITGKADLISIGADEYISVLQKKGLDLNKITSLPISLNMIRITIKKIEFLWSEFSKMGYDIKQVVEK